MVLQKLLSADFSVKSEILKKTSPAGVFYLYILKRTLSIILYFSELPESVPT